jgi:hypothetical protein
MGEIQYSTEFASVVPLSMVRQAFIERLQAAPLSLTYMDRIDLPNAGSTARLDRSAHVRVPRTTPGREGRGSSAAHVLDEVEVYLFTRVNPKAQAASEDEAADLEDATRAHLTAHHAWMGEWRVTYQGTPARGPSTTSAEWYVSQQTFTVSRYAALGG